MIFSEMTTKQAVKVLTESEFMDNVPTESVIHICNIPNVKYASCDKYIAKCKDGIVEFLATQPHGMCADKFINIGRVLRSGSGKKEIKNEIQRIKEEAELKMKHEQKILEYL
ncbi:hypothetical protein U8V72_15275 [Priestia filamentosa]|uniref:hypothetical protein n=1 Tax=Priestia filamentosa TaxID=1402861 RepID=UPI000B150D67